MLRAIRWCSIWPIVVLACMWGTVANTADEKREGVRTKWVPLFNGKNLEGWRVIDGNPTVVNGQLCLDRNAEIRAVDHFGLVTFRMEYECEGCFTVTLLEDSEVIMDGLRLFPQQRRRPIEAYITVEFIGGNMYRITAASSRAWAVSHGMNIVHSKVGRYPLRIRAGAESNVRFNYIEVAKDPLALD
jgi:hypothetical protein